MATVRCPKCGVENSVGSIYCKKCQNPIAGGRITCTVCGAQIDSDSGFCGECGAKVARFLDLQLDQNRWVKSPDDFSIRVDVHDLKGLFSKDVIVEEGTQALMFSNGEMVGTIRPGKHNMSNLGRSLLNLSSISSVAAVLVDIADVVMKTSVSDLFTKDPLNLTVDCEIVIRAAKSNLFFINIMKSRERLTKPALLRMIYPELQNAFNELLSQRSASELNTNLNLKKEFEAEIERHMRTTFSRNGLEIVQLRTINYRHEHYDKIRNIKQETFLLVSEDEAKRDRKLRLFDVYEKNELDEIAMESRKLEVFIKRNQVRTRVEAEIQKRKVDELKQAEEWERFKLEMDKNKLLRQEEWDSYRDAVMDKRDAREHLTRKVKMERENELEEIQQQRERIRGLAPVKLELEAKRMRGEQEREARGKDHEQDVREAEDGIEILKKMKAAKREDEFARIDKDLEREKKRIDMLSQASAEVLISMSGEKQAALIAELKKTEALKGVSPEQILAMAAEKSPEVAKAFAEKFKGESSEKIEALHREMLEHERADKKDQLDRMERMFGRMSEAIGATKDQQVKMAEKAMDRHADVAIARAATTGMRNCPACGMEVPLGLAFCKNCGKEFK